MTIAKTHEGLNDRNDLLYEDIGPASVADDANWTITLPAEFRGVGGGGAIPIVESVGSYGAGAPGARTFTFQPVVNIGSALVGVEVVTYVEATGVLTLTNRSGGALLSPRTYFRIRGRTSA